MLRYEYQDLDWTVVVFVDPKRVLSIQGPVLPWKESPKSTWPEGVFCEAWLSSGEKAVIPLSPDDFAAEVEEALKKDAFEVHWGLPAATKESP